MDKLTEFHKECIRNCINHKRATSYRSKYNKLSDEEVIRQCRSIAGYSDSQEFTLKELCEAQKLDINKVIEFISDVSNDINESDLEKFSLADWVIGYINTQRCNTIEGICDILNRQGYDVSIPRFKGIKRRNPDWTTEEIIGYCILNSPEQHNKIYYITVNGKQYSLAELCKKLGLVYNTIRENCITDEKLDIHKLLTYTNKLSINILGNIVGEIDDADIIKVKETLIEKCNRHNINYNTAKQFKSRHGGISDDLVIKALCTPDKLTAKDKCNIAGVDYKKVMHHKDKRPDKTVEQCIRYIKKRGETK